MNTISMNRDSVGITVQEGFAKFIRLKKLKKLSPATILDYESAYRYFGEFFDVTQSCADITQDTVLSYLEHLQTTRRANDVTINTYMKGLRTFLYYFMREGYMGTFKIELVKVDKAIKETYTNVRYLGGFGSQSACDRRLGLLRKAGLIDHKRIIYGVPSEYCLTYKPAAYVVHYY